jgi:hypothetical protein
MNARMRVFMFCLLLIVGAGSAVAQPAELYSCNQAPDCGAHGFSVSDDCGSAEMYGSRALWYPLRNVGPITISLWSLGGFLQDLPLYVEIVPLPDTLSANICPAGLPELPGFAVAVARGVQICGGGWETFGPFDLTPIVPLGGTYGLQLEGLYRSDGGQSFFTPGVSCVRIVTTPMQTEKRSWGMVKRLYR